MDNPVNVQQIDQATWVIEYRSECKHCNGTGVYKEYIFTDRRKKRGVVCPFCDGKGWATRRDTIHVFDNKQPANVDWVYETDELAILYAEHSGMPYKEWAEGNPFPEGGPTRHNECPAQWAVKSGNIDKKPKWLECHNATCFGSCYNYPEKQHCWKAFDKEQEEKERGKTSDQ